MTDRMFSQQNAMYGTTSTTRVTWYCRTRRSRARHPTIRPYLFSWHTLINTRRRRAIYANGGRWSRSNSFGAKLFVVVVLPQHVTRQLDWRIAQCRARPMAQRAARRLCRPGKPRRVDRTVRGWQDAWRAGPARRVRPRRCRKA